MVAFLQNYLIYVHIITIFKKCIANKYSTKLRQPESITSQSHATTHQLKKSLICQYCDNNFRLVLVWLLFLQNCQICVNFITIFLKNVLQTSIQPNFVGLIGQYCDNNQRYGA